VDIVEASTNRLILTIHLRREVIRNAKILAAQRGTSVSRLVETTIEDLVQDSDEYEAAKTREMERLRRARSLGSGGEGPSRDDLYDRPILR
jgi:hypothetical protein